MKPGGIRKLAKRKYKGYILEVDVRYLRELHDSTRTIQITNLMNDKRLALLIL